MSEVRYPLFDGKSELPALVPQPDRTAHQLNPRAAVLCYPRWLFQQISQREDATRYEWNSRGDIYCLGSTGNIVAVVAGLAVGAPAAVMLMEEFGAQGVRDFIIIGIAGGLQPDLDPGSITVCTKALRDEGTSHHYLPPGRWAEPDPELTNQLDRQLQQHAGTTHRGPTWTTDAPYRETKEELVAYRAEGVLTVEMEAAGLFAAAQTRGYRAAAAFVIYDLLSDTDWRRPQTVAPIRENMSAVANAAIQTLHGRASASGRG